MIMRICKTAHYWKLEATGNARAQYYSNQPLVRMRNTWLEATNDPMTITELVEQIKDGLLLKKSSGGQVDPIRGTRWQLNEKLVGSKVKKDQLHSFINQTIKETLIDMITNENASEPAPDPYEVIRILSPGFALSSWAINPTRLAPE